MTSRRRHFHCTPRRAGALFSAFFSRSLFGGFLLLPLPCVLCAALFSFLSASFVFIAGSPAPFFFFFFLWLSRTRPLHCAQHTPLRSRTARWHTPAAAAAATAETWEEANPRRARCSRASTRVCRPRKPPPHTSNQAETTHTQAPAPLLFFFYLLHAHPRLSHTTEHSGSLRLDDLLTVQRLPGVNHPVTHSPMLLFRVCPPPATPPQDTERKRERDREKERERPPPHTTQPTHRTV